MPFLVEVVGARREEEWEDPAIQKAKLANSGKVLSHDLITDQRFSAPRVSGTA